MQCAAKATTSSGCAFANELFAESDAAGAFSGDVTVASIYVPNGGKDFPAKMTVREAMDG